MILKPTLGIGELYFGQTQYEVKQIFGFPNIIDESWENKNELVYQYYRHKMSLHFYMEEGGRLGYIKCANPALEYCNKKIIQQDILKVKNIFEALLKTSWEEEPYEYYQTYFVAKHWLTLIVKYNEVIEVEIGIPYLANNKHDWKKANVKVEAHNVY